MVSATWTSDTQTTIAPGKLRSAAFESLARLDSANSSARQPTNIRASPASASWTTDAKPSSCVWRCATWPSAPSTCSPTWDGDTTGRIIIDRVMRAAARGVRVRLLIDDPYYNANDPVIAALDAHANVAIRLFNPFTNRRWSRLDFIRDFRRVNRRMHNKLMVTDHAAAIVGDATSATSITA